MKMRLKSLASLALVSLVAAGCATGSSDDVTMAAPEPTPVTFEVENTIEPAMTLSARIVRVENDSDKILGTVAPMAEQTFTWQPTGLVTDEYRLMAEATDGTQFASRAFTLVGASDVAWDVGLNVVVID